jgi:hypothetical protein
MVTWLNVYKTQISPWYGYLQRYNILPIYSTHIHISEKREAAGTGLCEQIMDS